VNNNILIIILQHPVSPIQDQASVALGS